MTSSEMDQESALRRDAESRLESGTAPPARSTWTLGPDALGMLYRLAADPDSAADALQLLHELQVHQVELGLQHEQMKAAEQDMTAELAQFSDLFAWAPQPYFVLDHEGVIADVNHAAVRLLAVGRDAVIGRNLTWFLGTESRPALQALFAELRGEGDAAGCDLHFNQSGGSGHVSACVPPGGKAVLMIVAQRQVPDAA